MNNKKLHSKVAALESQVDHLEAELIYINQLLVDFGFPDGVQSLKSSLEEVLAISASN